MKIWNENFFKQNELPEFFEVKGTEQIQPL